MSSGGLVQVWKWTQTTVAVISAAARHRAFSAAGLVGTPVGSRPRLHATTTTVLATCSRITRATCTWARFQSRDSDIDNKSRPIYIG